MPGKHVASSSPSLGSVLPVWHLASKADVSKAANSVPPAAADAVASYPQTSDHNTLTAEIDLSSFSTPCRSLKECQGLKETRSLSRHLQAPTNKQGVLRSRQALPKQQNFHQRH